MKLNKRVNVFIFVLLIMVVFTSTLLITSTNAVTIYTLTVTPVNNGKATVNLTPPGITVKNATTMGYLKGRVITLTANDYMVQPEITGWKFQSWGGDATGSARTITVTMDRNKSVTAQYSAIAIDWPTPTPATGSLAANFAIVSDFGSGCSYNVTLKNNSSVAMNGWRIAWTLVGDQTITTMWSATYTQSGASVTATGNQTILPNGGTCTFGFNVTGTGRGVILK